MSAKNVIVILTDQMRKDSIGAYGNPFACTPNLDRLCAESVQFDRMYVANPICSPSRMSMLSGMVPSNHCLETNGQLKKDDGRTLPHELRRHGYHTASIGKIHVNPYSEESSSSSFESAGHWPGVPDEDVFTGGYFGFDHVELTIGHTLPKAHYYKWFLENGGDDSMFGVTDRHGDSQDELCGTRNMPTRLSSTAYIAERAVRYIHKAGESEQPFFLSVSFPDPHHPFTSCWDDYEKWKDRSTAAPIGSSEDLVSRPAWYMEHFRGEWHRWGLDEAIHSNGVNPEVSQARRRHTYAMVEAIDRAVGQVIDAVKEAGLLDDTIILFTSDHGELLGDHGLWLKGPFFYEGLINTPFILRHPNIPARRSSALFSGLDLAPTILDMLGFEIPDYMDGVSQLSVLQNTMSHVRTTCPIEYRNGYDRDVSFYVLVGENYKYGISQQGDEEYTDLLLDPEEQNNVAEDPRYQDAVAAARKCALEQKLCNKRKGVPQYGHA